MKSNTILTIFLAAAMVAALGTSSYAKTVTHTLTIYSAKTLTPVNGSQEVTFNGSCVTAVAPCACPASVTPTIISRTSPWPGTALLTWSAPDCCQMNGITSSWTPGDGSGKITCVGHHSVCNSVDRDYSCQINKSNYKAVYNHPSETVTVPVQLQ